jgi:hypothetical protein
MGTDARPAERMGTSICRRYARTSTTVGNTPAGLPR